MSERYHDKYYKWKVFACYLWGLPWAALGLMLCLTIIFVPIGLIAFTIAGLPLSWQQKKHLERMREWEDRDQPMPNEAMKPWLQMDFESSSSASLIDEVEPDA